MSVVQWERLCKWEMTPIVSPAPPFSTLLAFPVIRPFSFTRLILLLLLLLFAVILLFFSPLPLIFHSFQAALMRTHTLSHTHASVSPLCICSRLQSGPLEMDQSRRSNDGVQAHGETRSEREREREERVVKL